MNIISEHTPKRGFVTIATGDPKYYQFAVNLLRSYRQNSADTAPFTLICDRECAEAREFDSFVLMKKAHRSYLDKLALSQYIPYEETIFVDADSLVLRDTRDLWTDFEGEPDFCCYGRVYPLESRRGWFFYEGMGELKPLLTYNVNLHGGIYYMRKTEECSQVFAKALELLERYDQYSFSTFEAPADEPLLALAMAIMGIKPREYCGRMLYLPHCNNQLKLRRDGKLVLNKREVDPVFLHFGNRNLGGFLYAYFMATVEYHLKGGTGNISRKEYLELCKKCMPHQIKRFGKNILLKIFPKKVIINLKKILR